MKEQKEKIVEALQNSKVLIQELENYIGTNNHIGQLWIDNLSTQLEIIKHDLFRIVEN